MVTWSTNFIDGLNVFGTYKVWKYNASVAGTLANIEKTLHACPKYAVFAIIGNGLGTKPCNSFYGWMYLKYCYSIYNAIFQCLQSRSVDCIDKSVNKWLWLCTMYVQWINLLTFILKFSLKICCCLNLLLSLKLSLVAFAWFECSKSGKNFLGLRAISWHICRSLQ